MKSALQQPTAKQEPASSGPDFGVLFDSAPIPFLVLLTDDPVFTIVAVNKAYMQLTEVPRENLLGRGLFEIFPENAADSNGTGNLLASFRRAVQTRAPDTLTLRYDRPRFDSGTTAGKERYWNATNVPFLRVDGSVEYLLHSTEEVTDKVQRARKADACAQQLQTCEQRFSQLAETGGFGLVIAGFDGSLSYFNPAVRQLLGYTEEDVAAGLVRWDQLTAPEFADSDARAWQEVLATGRCAPYEKVYLAKDGRRVPILTGASLLGEVQGRKEVAAFILDLTERRQNEQDAFLVRLDDATRPLIDPDQLMQTVARLLGEYLKVDRCAYGTFDPDEAVLDVSWDYTRPGVPSMVGRYPITAFGEDTARLFRADLPQLVEDSELDLSTAEARAAYPEVSVRAHASVPLHKDGRLVAAIAVHQYQTPRRWLAQDVELLRLVAHRCWESINRLQVTRELHESERRLRLAQRAGRIGSFEWLMKENKVIWSPELEALYGLPEGSFRGTLDDWRARVVGEDAGPVLAGIEDAIARGEAEHAYEFRAILPDGRLRWLRGQAQLIYNNTGAPERMLGINIDIDDQKQAEEHLRRQWQAFDTTLSNMPDFAYTFDLQGRFTYVNQSLLALLQRPLQETLGKNFFDLDYPPELAERLQRQIQQVITTRQPLRDDTPFPDPAGEIHYFEYILVPVLDAEGQVEAVAGSTRDITERQQIEKALAASKESLQQVFAQAPVAIAVFGGRDFIVELANLPYQALLQRRDLAGRRFADVFPNFGQDVWDVLRRVFETGEPFIANSWYIPYDYDSDGVVEDHWFDVAYTPRRDSNGSVSGIIAVLTDVTVQVQARKELERVNRDLEEFAYVASHDLQEPLRMVSIYTQLLLKNIAGEEQRLSEYAGFVKRGVARMEALIRDLLTFSRAVHTEESSIRTADLSASLTEALSVLKHRVEETAAIVSAAPLPLTRGETSQMAHVFENLLSNALKYRKKEESPQIQVLAGKEGDYWVISVRDNGIGFEPQYAERIFGLFKRLHQEEYPGTGLGLTICQRIVERYGGRIWAEGKPGEGATFHFSLPCVKE